MNPDRTITVSFTGYRPEKILKTNSSPGIYSEIANALRVVVPRLYDKGYRRFLTGMAEGFDLIAAAVVLSLIAEGVCPEAQVIAIVPYRGQSAGYSKETGAEYTRILSGAAEVHYLSEAYYPRCFHVRNDFLVDNASAIVAYFDGQPGGTAYTVSRARKEGLTVVNLCNPDLFGFS